jgi:eukaryotic-like serine/threonine-protein kinase
VIGSAQLIGARLGNYEIQALLGAGGMASVYRGFDHNLRRPVAIKVLSDLAAQPDVAARFQQEAQLIAGLRHPNIVQVYDFGQHDGLIYMVQELLPGLTLQQWLRDLAARGARPARDDVLTIVGLLASALDAAHAAGIIHRDVKPANAIWNSAGELVLTDFGIAKHIQLPGLTQTGLVIGTPDYLSPEQAQGQPLTPSSDVYSLGVVLYELLAGRLPFVAGTALGVAMSHIHDAPPLLRSQRPDLPAAVEALVQQALAKDPSARFRSAGALARALAHAWPADHSAAVPPANIHEQPTRVWEAGAARAVPASTPRPLTVATPENTTSSAARPAAPRSKGRFVGMLLIALLIGMGAFIARAVWQPADRSPAAPAAETAPIASQPSSAPVTQATSAPPPTEVPVAAPPAPTDAPAPTEVPATEPPAPTDTPAPTAVPATVPPAPTEAPATAEPTNAPAPASDSIDQLRILLEAGRDDGRSGRAGGAMLSDLSKAKQALDDGNKQRATDRLRDLQKRLLDGAKSKKVEANFAQQALAGIDAIASTYGLELPPPREKNDGEKGE